MSGQPDPARNRFFIIGLARLAGAIVAVAGIVLTYREGGTNDPLTGFVITAAGLVTFVVLPRALARQWRTPEPEPADPPEE